MLTGRQAKHNKATKSQKSISASEEELRDLNTRQKKWSVDQNHRPGAGNKGSKYTSNKTHYSPVDPDARISVKPGKARKLNYFAQLGVDTSNHVITHIHADYANQKDNQCLQRLVNEMKSRLITNGVHIENILADAGYSSGENCAYLEREKLKSYIPPHGTYKGGPQGFTYIEEEDYWLCRNNVKVTFRGLRKGRNGVLKKAYYSKRSHCSKCPFKLECLGKSHEKRIEITAYKAEYDRAIQRLKKDKWHKAKRMSTVEPVFGTLLNYMGLRKVNTRGILQANKCMLLAATAYNLKKLMKHNPIKRTSMPIAIELMIKSTKRSVETAFYFVLSLMKTHSVSRLTFRL